MKKNLKNYLPALRHCGRVLPSKMKSVKLNTRITHDLRKKLKVKAAQDGVSIQKLVQEALEKFLK